MQSHENRGRGQPGLTVPLGLSVILLVLFSTLSDSHARSRARRKHSANAPATEQQTQAVASDGGADAAYIFVKGAGILRVQDRAVSTVLATPAALRDLQIDKEGALWASLRGVGVVRNLGGHSVTLNPDSFAKLAIRSPTDVWTINDSHGSVLHYDGRRWKTVRTRNSLAGAFDDNRLLDIVTDGRAVWVSSWNGLWRVVGERWTRIEPPPAAVANSDAENDGQPAPAFPLSVFVAKPGLLACYLSGCFLSADSGWQPSHWPTERAHLQSAGAGNLVAGTSADGQAVVIARLEGSDKASTSESLPATGINDIAIDTSGRVWVATGAELIILDAGGRILQRWKTDANSGQAGEIERVVIAGAGPAKLPAK
ncbi:MAG TPA: two-component regulator propeller domain-containing protein [Polyangia bacterium]